MSYTTSIAPQSTKLMMTYNEKKKAIVRMLKALPKVELHRHLEGSLRLGTLVDIAQQHGVDLQSYDLEDLRPLVQMVNDEPNFQEFLAKFAVLRKFYRAREAIERIAYEVVADAADDNVRYLELRFNPVALAATQGFAFGDVADWVINAVNKAQQDHLITVRLIIQMGRHEPQYARQLAELAVARQDKGVVAVDLAGDEEHFTAAKFIDIMRWAKAEGLHITAHAGECCNCAAENIREAIEVIEADRIGHGVQAIKDPSVVRLLRQHNIPLEMCPTSNLQTGAVLNLWQHPLRRLLNMGLPITLNTDDPSISNITLSDEYIVAHFGIGVELQAIKTMILNAARSTFLPPPERQELVSWFEQELSRFDLSGLE